jgi:hypothetical protein
VSDKPEAFGNIVRMKRRADRRDSAARHGARLRRQSFYGDLATANSEIAPSDFGRDARYNDLPRIAAE